MLDLPTGVVLALVGALIALVVTRWWRAWRGSWRARRRGRRAVTGERGAAELLERAGFRIVAVQARIEWSPVVDGEPLAVELHADYLVEGQPGDDGRCERLVAEVKTGDQAPLLTTAATRRQLLEYRVAWRADGVLLVCPERGQIHRVDFPL